MSEELYLQYAAHVGHAVTHSSTTGKLTLAVGGIVIGVAIAIFAAPEAVTMAVVLEGASTVGTYGSAGKIVGGLIDTFVAPSKAGEIISGLDTVLLGPGIRPAARVHEDTHASCDGAIPAEGSKIVMLGPERRPMSRRGDRLECKGIISEGIDSIIVGGIPSKKGVEIEERDPLKWLGVGLDILSLPKELGWKLAVGVAQVGLEAADQDRAAKLAGVPLDKPKGVASWIKSISDAKDAGGAALPAGHEGHE
jgi:hypothetical protein